jgi:hypothetical protein
VGGESVSIDQMSNHVSIFDILEQVNVDDTKLPRIIPKFCVVAAWLEIYLKVVDARLSGVS